MGLIFIRQDIQVALPDSIGWAVRNNPTLRPFIFFVVWGPHRYQQIQQLAKNQIYDARRFAHKFMLKFLLWVSVFFCTRIH